MSDRAQFDGMRVHHDEHRALVQNRDYRSWRDCDTCIAIAVVDELDARITAAEKVVAAARALDDARLAVMEAQADKGMAEKDHWDNVRVCFARLNLASENLHAALTDATEQGPRGGSK